MKGSIVLAADEIWSHFMQHYVYPGSQRKIWELERYFRSHIHDFVPDFLDSFRQLCLKIKAMQLNKEKDKIAFISFSMLRTAILGKSPIYLIEATTKDRFLDGAECWGEYHPGWAFQFLDQLDLEWEEKRKPYFGRVTRIDVERLKLREAKKYHQYVVSLIRYVMPRAAELPEFQEIEKEEILEVRAGGYLDAGEVVFKEDRQPKDSARVKTRLEEENKIIYEFEILTRLNLAGGNYGGVNLRYSDLRESDLSNSRMDYCTLTGVRFNRASLQNADFSESLIHEADFGECNLKGADFYQAGGGEGIDEGDWGRPGFLKVSFKGADLEGANFGQADLRGAIFTGAHLKNVNFEGANLEKTVFSKDSANLLNIDEEQSEGIIWE